MTDQEKWVRVASVAALPAGEMTSATIGDEEIAIYNVDGEFYATANLCTHAFALLTDGFLDGETIECPLHGGCFNVKTGKAECPPVSVDLKIYLTRVRGDDVEIALQSQGTA